MGHNNSPWKIKQPCSADWNRMRGDDKRRFCEGCQKFVHNVSAMSREERTAFADPANSRECIFICQRTDGKIADLSLLAVFRRWFPFLRLASWTALVALLPLALTGCMGVQYKPMLGEPRPVPTNNTTPDGQIAPENK
jgi:hypothetical protein